MLRSLIADPTRPTATTRAPTTALADAIDRAIAVLEFSLDGTILRANQTYLDILGYTESDLIGRNFSLLVSPDYAAGPEYAAFWAALRAGQHLRRRVQRRTKSGGIIWLEADYFPVPGTDGRPASVTGHIHDITATVAQAAEDAGQIAAINRAQAVASFALDGTILSANENFLALMGYRLAEITGQHHSLFVSRQEAAAPAYQNFWQRLNAGESVAGEFHRLARGGRDVWIQASYNPILDPAGKPVKIIKLATDITAAKQKTADDAAQIAAIGRTQAVIAFDPQGNILSANENFLRTMGYTAAELIGRHHRMFVDATYAASPGYAHFWEALRAGQLETGEFRRVAKDGHAVWLQASYTPIHDLSGNLIKIVKYATDVTAIVRQRAKMNLLSLVADETDNAVLITDHNHRIIYANGGFERMSGFSFAEVRGHPPGQFLHGPATDLSLTKDIYTRLQAGEMVHVDHVNYTKDKKPYWISMTVNPVINGAGVYDRFVVMQTNITESKQRADDFTAKLNAIGNYSGIAEWTIEGAALTANEILSGGHPFDLPLAKLLDAEAIAHIRHHGSLRREVSVARGEAEPMWFDAIFSVLNNMEGKPERILMCGGDITARRLAVSASIAGMSDMLTRISGILGAISGFARQTNLLSVNAAIEAARAQESGRGFAIIAQEIRKLATGASTAIGEIETLLTDGAAQVEAMSETGR